MNGQRRANSHLSSAIALVFLAGLLTACGGGSSSSSQGANPTLSSVSPATGTVGTELNIVGTEFRSGVAVSLDGIAMDFVEMTSATQVFANVPTGIAVDTPLAITVRNADGTQVTLANAFTTVAPTLQFVNSATKPSGNVGSTVILEGDAFGDLEGIGQILFSDGAGGTIPALIASADDWINTFIVTTVPSGAEDGPVLVTTATGTSASLPFNVTSAATFSPSTISWTAATDLPLGVSGHAAAFVPIDDVSGTTNRFVHVLGGASNDGVPLTSVDVAAIQADGTLSAWTAISPLPAARAFHGLVAATPFNSKVLGNGELYILGGIETVDGPPTTNVYRASLNEDGTVGAWSETQPLPEALHSLGVVIFRGAIYVAGGATVDNVPVASVYRARPDTTGELGAWDQLPALPSIRAHHGFVTFGGFLYAVGGESAPVSPNDGTFVGNATKLSEVVWAKINLRTGDLDTSFWTIDPKQMNKVRSKHSTLAAGGNLFVTSGLYNGAGTGSSENTFAQINADGSIEPFTGATGSNTLLSQGGANLFNQAAVSYVDANGVAHVMVIGGDDVNNPGNKRITMLFY